MFHPLPPHTIRVRDTGSTTDMSNLRMSYVAFAITSILFSPYDQPRGPELVELVAPSTITNRARFNTHSHKGGTM